MKIIIILLITSNIAFTLETEFKNEAFDGKNKLERIDANAAMINKILGELNSLKAEIAGLKSQISAQSKDQPLKKE